MAQMDFVEFVDIGPCQNKGLKTRPLIYTLHCCFEERVRTGTQGFQSP